MKMIGMKNAIKIFAILGLLFLFPNVFADTDDPTGNPSGCCMIGVLCGGEGISLICVSNEDLLTKVGYDCSGLKEHCDNGEVVDWGFGDGCVISYSNPIDCDAPLCPDFGCCRIGNTYISGISAGTCEQEFSGVWGPAPCECEVDTFCEGTKIMLRRSNCDIMEVTDCALFADGHGNPRCEDDGSGTPCCVCNPTQWCKDNFTVGKIDSECRPHTELCNADSCCVETGPDTAECIEESDGSSISARGQRCSRNAEYVNVEVAILPRNQNPPVLAAGISIFGINTKMGIAAGIVMGIFGAVLIGLGFILRSKMKK